MNNNCNLSLYHQTKSPSKKMCVLYQILCEGTREDKKSCPAWGPTIEAEKYYDAKIEEDRDFNKNRLDILSYQ
jgi:hypothetical protein